MAINPARLHEKAERYGIILTETQMEQLQAYAQLLVEWNQKMNLTAITHPEEMEDKHFLDCLLFASQPQVQGSLIDVGSGAGFPGAVAKILKPQLAVTLMESTGKRVLFLQELSQTIGLSLRLEKARAEEAGRKLFREKYDVSTARAVASLPVLCEYCLPLVKVGGRFIALKGDPTEELKVATNAIERLGGKLLPPQAYTLPDGAQRSLITIEKVSPTPEAYPRNGGAIAKRPL